MGGNGNILQTTKIKRSSIIHTAVRFRSSISNGSNIFSVGHIVFSAPREGFALLHIRTIKPRKSRSCSTQQTQYKSEYNNKCKFRFLHGFTSVKFLICAPVATIEIIIYCKQIFTFIYRSIKFIMVTTQSSS